MYLIDLKGNLCGRENDRKGREGRRKGQKETFNPFFTSQCCQQPGQARKQKHSWSPSRARLLQPESSPTFFPGYTLAINLNGDFGLSNKVL